MIILTLSYPSFVNEDQNYVLMKEVTSEEVKEFVHSMQKDKIPRPDGWHVEILLGFMTFFNKIYI